MVDARVGAAFRAVPVRRGWRQLDVADKAGVSQSLVSLIERGHLERVTIETLRAVASVLDIRIDVVAAWLRRLGWEVAPEVSFAIAGERGWIDLLAWHAPTRTLLVIELKTEIVDFQDLLGV